MTKNHLSGNKPDIRETRILYILFTGNINSRRMSEQGRNNPFHSSFNAGGSFLRQSRIIC